MTFSLGPKLKSWACFFKFEVESTSVVLFPEGDGRLYDDYRKLTLVKPGEEDAKMIVPVRMISGGYAVDGVCYGY